MFEEEDELNPVNDEISPQHSIDHRMQGNTADIDSNYI